MCLVFIVGVLRVENEDVAAVEKLNQFSACFLRARACLFRTQGFTLRGMNLEIVVLFVVRKKSDRSLGGVEAISDANTGMIHRLSAHFYFADIEIVFLELLDFDTPGQGLKFHR